MSVHYLVNFKTFSNVLYCFLSPFSCSLPVAAFKVTLVCNIPTVMVGSYQRTHRSEPSQTRHRQADHITLPTARTSAASHDQLKAKTVEDIVGPAFHFPFNGTYASQAEISEDESPVVYATEANHESTFIGAHQGITTANITCFTASQDRNRRYNYGHEPSYVSIARPWDEQHPEEVYTYQTDISQTQTPLTDWERQESIVEPFNNIGEVATKPSHPWQNQSSIQASQHRRGGRKKRREC